MEHLAPPRSDQLLELVAADPSRLPEIERELRERYERTQAVMVVDMCGLSERTRRYGPVHALALVHQLRTIARPAIETSGGALVEMVADDLLCLFDDASEALAAGDALLAATEAENMGLQPEWHVDVSIGIGYGPLLDFDRRRIAGVELNLASKLAEDVAAAREMIVTESAWERVESWPGRWRRDEVTVGDASAACYRRTGPPSV